MNSAHFPLFSQEDCTLPEQFTEYIHGKLTVTCQGGRPHFIKALAREKDPETEVLNILEMAWLKSRSIASIARKYGTKYLTVWRMLQDLEPWKAALVTYLEQTPRRKVFYNRDQDSSDYEAVTTYIRRAKRDGLKTYKEYIKMALKVWRYLKYRDPAGWTAEEVHEFLNTRSEGSQSLFLDAIRRVAPQISDKNSPDYVRTGKYREKLSLRKKDCFGPEVEMVLEALKDQGLKNHETVLKLHISLGAREGSRDSKSGMVGLSWGRFKRDFSVADLYESKVRGGIWWRNCPLDLFFKELPAELKRLWISRGRPSDEKIILGGYHELLRIYREIRKALKLYYRDLADPSLLKELATLRPHDADKIHVNLLWEAGVPLEVVAGKYLGRGEGVGLFGRGWLDINTLKKHYLSLTERSERIQILRRQVQSYSLRFHEGKSNTQRARIPQLAVCQ